MFRKRTWMLVAVLALSFTLYGCMQNFTGLEGAHGFGPVSASGASQRYVVAFNAEAIPPDAEAIVAASGGTLAKTFPRIGIAIAQSSDPDFAQNLGKNASVYAVSVERHHDLPPLEVEVFEEASGPDPGIDTYYYQYQWDIRRVRADQAWEITSGSHNTVVAVLDTGVAWNHPDLAPNVVYHSCYSVFSPCTDYPNLHWHGTHVAGTVAAAFGGGRTVGVGPNLGIASYNVFEYFPGYGVVAFDEAIWAAMLDVAERGYDIINMSLGGYVIKVFREDVANWVAWNRVVDYVNRAGVTVVASAGNAAFDLNGPVDSIPSDLPGVISVAATGIRPDSIWPQDGGYDVQAFYSNSGAAVTLAAPGGDLGPPGTFWPFPAAYYLVFSTYVYLDPTCAAAENCPAGYAWAGGTSMAAPHVSGTAGLILDSHGDLNPEQVRAILKRTAENIGSRQIFGHGIVNAYDAVH